MVASLVNDICQTVNAGNIRIQPQPADTMTAVKEPAVTKPAVRKPHMLRRKWEIAVALTGLSGILIACGGSGGGSSSMSTNTSGTSTNGTSTTGTSTSGTTTGSSGGTTAPPIKTKAELGQALFNDTTLSNPKGMSCGTCHSAQKAFTDPRPGFPVSEGVIKGRFMFRNAPSIQYIAYSPDFSLGNGQAGNVTGGQFWDGHARNLIDQVHFPLVNPLEMNNHSSAEVVASIAAGPYASALKKLYGADVFTNSTNAFNAVVDAIATFEKTPAVSPFSSKYDAFLKGQAELTPAETRGLAAFNGQAGCAGCHTSAPDPKGTPPLFTNFCYANLGLPKNPDNPYYTISSHFNPQGKAFVDLGLERTTGRAEDAGNFMTPSLRNVALTGPYFHNGIFTTLAQVVHFYNTRDLGGFAPPEVPGTEDTTELGNLHLTAQQESDIVAFIGTLTDGYASTNGFSPGSLHIKGARP